MILVALMGMGVEAVNEVVEFFASELFASNVGGYTNTGWGLVANLVGCTLAAVVVSLSAEMSMADRHTKGRSGMEPM